MANDDEGESIFDKGEHRNAAAFLGAQVAYLLPNAALRPFLEGFFRTLVQRRQDASVEKFWRLKLWADQIPKVPDDAFRWQGLRSLPALDAFFRSIAAFASRALASPSPDFDDAAIRARNELTGPGFGKNAGRALTHTIVATYAAKVGPTVATRKKLHLEDAESADDAFYQFRDHGILEADDEPAWAESLAKPGDDEPIAVYHAYVVEPLRCLRELERNFPEVAWLGRDGCAFRWAEAFSKKALACRSSAKTKGAGDEATYRILTVAILSNATDFQGGAVFGVSHDALKNKSSRDKALADLRSAISDQKK